MYFSVATAERVATQYHTDLIGVRIIVQCLLTCASFTFLQKRGFTVIGTTVQSVADKLLVPLCRSFWYVFKTFYPMGNVRKFGKSLYFNVATAERVATGSNHSTTQIWLECVSCCSVCLPVPVLLFFKKGVSLCHCSECSRQTIGAAVP